jgi:hypothetical protein
VGEVEAVPLFEKLLAPAKASMLFDATPHDDWIRVNATYE